MTLPTNVEARTRRSSRHDRTGCLTCRYRHKKCTENTFPVCGACQRLNLECLRQPQRRIEPPRPRVAPATTPSQTAAFSPAMPSLGPSLHTTRFHLHPVGARNPNTRRQAMSYYVERLSGLLAVSKENNSFLTDFIPMAMESQALAEAILAYSAGHLSLTEPAYLEVALEARSRALQALSQDVLSLGSDLHRFETTASTCLVLLTSEVCLTGRANWHLHLTGARHILGKSGCVATFTTVPTSDDFKSLKVSSQGKWVLRNFAYHDIIASVTLGTKPLVAAEYLAGITDVTDSYLGVGTSILMCISDIGCFGGENAPADVASILLWYGETQHRLRVWQCPIDTPATLQSLAAAYRSAALLHLYRRCRQLLARQAERPLLQLETRLIHDLSSNTETEVSRCLDAIRDIPLTDPAESALLFPLFLAGGDAVDKQQVIFVKDRLNWLYSQRRFENILQALQVLDMIWSRRQVDEELFFEWSEFFPALSEPLVLF